jgi:hypothetical protein
MTKGRTNGTLLYRGTRDGFTIKGFDRQCGNKTKTVTIIKTIGNYVFGGYTAAKWIRTNISNYWLNDSSAFIFSLRRNGTSKSVQFKIQADSSRAIYGGDSNSILRFGGGVDGGGTGHDFGILENSDQKNGSWSTLCVSYTCSTELKTLFKDLKLKKNFLAGEIFITPEIEVYQIYN